MQIFETRVGSFSSFCSDNQKFDTQTCWWYTWQLIRFLGSSSQMVRTWLDAVVVPLTMVGRFHVGGGCINFRITQATCLANNFKVVIGMARCRFSAPRFGSRVPNTLITLFTLVCIKVELKENAIILQNSRCYENEEEVDEGTTFFFLSLWTII